LTVRHIAIGLLAGAALVVAAAVAASPFPGLALRIVYEELHPASVSWEGKTAWRRCDSAIAGETSWPSSPGAACEAMHLCADEAPLSEPQKAALLHAIHATPGCQEP
jgi:hypothetical protein